MAPNAARTISCNTWNFPVESIQCFQRYGFRKVWPNCCIICQVFGPLASPYGSNRQTTMPVHNYRLRQFHRTSNGENPSSGYRDMRSTSLAATRPAARTLTTITLQPGRLRVKNIPLTNSSQFPVFHWLLMIQDKSQFAITTVIFIAFVSHNTIGIC